MSADSGTAGGAAPACSGSSATVGSDLGRSVDAAASSRAVADARAPRRRFFDTAQPRSARPRSPRPEPRLPPRPRRPHGFCVADLRAVRQSQSPQQPRWCQTRGSPSGASPSDRPRPRRLFLTVVAVSTFRPEPPSTGQAESIRASPTAAPPPPAATGLAIGLAGAPSRDRRNWLGGRRRRRAGCAACGGRPGRGPAGAAAGAGAGAVSGSRAHVRCARAGGETALAAPPARRPGPASVA